MRLAPPWRMGVKTLDELQAYQGARALRLEVYRLVEKNPRMERDLRFRDQLRDAAASAEMNVAEGFRRFSAADFSRFLKIARGSVEETQRWLQDGIDRKHFTQEQTETAFALADRAGRLITGLIISLKPFIRDNPGSGPPARKR